eukprot:285498-Prorocentrum_lima.AAC.1
MTPSPNHAETAVRLFKQHALILFDSVKTYQHMEPNLTDVSVSDMAREAAWVRNMSVTNGGKTPAEIPF